jgi:predicted PhzF superfamily epimerase YddE/YHI9
VSDAGGYVTGQTIVVDGGVTIMCATRERHPRLRSGRRLEPIARSPGTHSPWFDTDRLSTDQMQLVAPEFNLSETTFVLPTTDDATYRARILTPTTELPSAGHPSVGTAWLLVHLGRHEAGALVQECGAGLVQIVVDDNGAALTGAAPTQSDVVDEAPYLQQHLAHAVASSPSRARRG